MDTVCSECGNDISIVAHKTYCSSSRENRGAKKMVPDKCITCKYLFDCTGEKTCIIPETEQKKLGRPPGSTSTLPTRDVIKQIRWTAQEWESIEAAAKAKGQTVAKYQRERVLR